ncbi:SpaH/EbpB family LPXTG-anchored major pilin [Gemmiger formicilis]|uniref:SpaH/EbpB family LPXTG-anchored major pilin n=1 Tax=Gemmiger formicilis TaxID=745368 RepID=UPI001D0EBAC8|nr:SpaH/EbpB family LPXTG-anchored major pilin [Gemmiger formicilis]MCC2192725.1 SpaH/EbpB family LPXTG-anchored major pilin [Gemmiger formicilis]
MKLKRLFTAILSAALTLSLCAMPAMATEGGTTAGTPLADGMPVWDTTKKGSITIHKFEYNPSSGAPSQQGTGAEGEGAPAGATPLDGVTFEIYQVQSQTWLESYYGGQVTASSQDFSKMDASDYYTKNSTTGAITVNSGATKVATVTTTTTETDKGVAKKDGLALGLYLVVETKAPDKVTSPADPFLVSVPMTRIADNDTTNKLTDWIYDVHVYPKNSTTYGQVTIEKKGYTGGGTGVALEGVQFKLQKQNGADWTDITANDSNGSTYNLTTDINGKITIAGLSQGEYRIFEDAYSNTSANKGYILDAEYHTFTVQKDGKIQVDGNVSANATIQVANHRPDMKKEVYNGTEWKQDAQYGVGDTVPYKITIEVPKNIDKLSTFTVTDTPTGLTDNVSSIEVKDDTTDLTKNTHYTVADNGNGFTITFTPAEMAAYAGEKLVITYTATVSNDAVVGGKGNSNNAKLTYTNKINTHGSPAAPSTNTIEDSAVMYSFGIKVKKTTEDGTTPLQGVVFDLYREAKTGETPIVNAETVKKTGLDSTKSWILVKSGLTTDANGIIDTSDSANITNYTHGLANGDYYLVETKTVKGYNLLTKPVEVKLDVTATTTWQKTNVYDASGNLVKHGTVTKTTFTHTSNNGDATKTELAVAKVVNRKGFTLPVTGGFGTLLFSGIGVLLVLAGVGVLFSLKKKPNRA